jgi:hypothetical protein
MKKSILCVALLLSLSAYADDNCATRTAQLLAQGNVEQLAALFPDPLEVRLPLTQLLNATGSISGIQEVASPGSRNHKRLSVQSTLSAQTSKYEGFWVNLDSEKLGPSQLHIAKLPGTVCSLLAIHLDTPR